MPAIALPACESSSRVVNSTPAVFGCSATYEVRVSSVIVVDLELIVRWLRTGVADAVAGHRGACLGQQQDRGEQDAGHLRVLCNERCEGVV